jgi:hypothetical protein
LFVQPGKLCDRARPADMPSDGARNWNPAGDHPTNTIQFYFNLFFWAQTDNAALISFNTRERQGGSNVRQPNNTRRHMKSRSVA